MNKKQKTILLCLAMAVIIAFSGYLLRSCLYEPPRQETIDSLEYIKDQARQNADYNKSLSDSDKKFYEQSLKNIDAPIGSDEREKLFARIDSAAKADSIRRGAIR